MTRTQSNTLLALDACIVAMQNKLRQIENSSEKGTPENDIAKSALKEGDKAENLIYKLAEILK